MKAPELLAKIPEYNAWRGMRLRCRNPKHRWYHRYGGRGIKICERWDSYANFLSDVGPRPSPKHSIDRINNDGDYEPGNVRWATPDQQARNRHNALIVTFRGAAMLLKDAAALAGADYTQVSQRIRQGWDAVTALQTPVRNNRGPRS